MPIVADELPVDVTVLSDIVVAPGVDAVIGDPYTFDGNTAKVLIGLRQAELVEVEPGTKDE
jgi:hypothetical protein